MATDHQRGKISVIALTNDSLHNSTQPDNKDLTDDSLHESTLPNNKDKQIVPYVEKKVPITSFKPNVLIHQTRKIVQP